MQILCYLINKVNLAKHTQESLVFKDLDLDQSFYVIPFFI